MAGVPSSTRAPCSSAMRCTIENQAATLTTAPRRAVKPLEHPRALEFRYTGSVVRDRECDTVLPGRDGYLHASAGRRIADGVVHQIAYQDRERRGIPLNCTAAVFHPFDLDVLLQRRRRTFPDHGDGPVSKTRDRPGDAGQKEICTGLPQCCSEDMVLTPAVIGQDSGNRSLRKT